MSLHCYSPTTVSKHKIANDAWISIHGNVYDVTNFITVVSMPSPLPIIIMNIILSVLVLLRSEHFFFILSVLTTFELEISLSSPTLRELSYRISCLVGASKRGFF